MKGLTELRVSERLKQLRENNNLTIEEVARGIKVNPAWLGSWEDGSRTVPVNIIFDVIDFYGLSAAELLDGIDFAEEVQFPRRSFDLVETNGKLSMEFDYNDYRAELPLEGVREQDALKELEIFRERLTKYGKSDAIAATFLELVSKWPEVNPADIWFFFIHRAYLDRYSHKIEDEKRDMGQSWKRSAGWAFERVIVDYYNPLLKSHGVRLLLPEKKNKKVLIERLGLDDSSVSDKADIYIVTGQKEKVRVHGVVHAKVSIAERRSDDEPLSRLLMDKGLLSPLVTLDAKAFPGTRPVVKGEYGPVITEAVVGSEKRRAVEEKGAFSNVYSFNSNTIPTPDNAQAKARIHTISFSGTEDQFVHDVVEFVTSTRHTSVEAKVGETKEVGR